MGGQELILVSSLLPIDTLHKVKASACDSGVQGRPVNPISHRALFQSDGGVCTVVEEVAEGNIGAAPLLEIFVLGSESPIGSSRYKASNPSQSVSVQVNRQQGKQSWLKLGTQTLANLGRTTLMGSVSYALLPGVHWLASLGEPAVGEKVALEG